METKHKKLRNLKEYKKYYKESDQNFMTLEQSLFAHRHLDRVAWARKWIHELSCRNIIDCGAKDGYTCLTLASEGVECVGIDPSEDAIEEAKLKAREAKLDITFLVGYAEKIPNSIKADAVIALELLEHVIDPDVLLKRLCEVGSYVLISTPDAKGNTGMKDAERNEEHLRIYTKEELEELISKYGKIIESVARDNQLCIIYKPK